MPSINESIQDLVISHQHYVERYKTFEVKKLQTFLTKADREIRQTLQNANITKWTRRRQTKMLETINEIQRTYNTAFNAAVVNDFKAFGSAEANTTAKIINTTMGDVLKLTALDVEIPGPSAIWSAANSNPLMLDDGAAVNLRPFLKGVGNRRLKIIEDTLRYGYALGESSTQIAWRLVGTAASPGTLAKSKRSVEIMTRTSLNHMSSVARRETYHANTSIVSGYQWISTLDVRTTDICQFRDNRVWYFDGRARAVTDQLLLEGEVYPPAHTGCRSSSAPLTKSWRQLGLKGKDGPPAIRASANGEVPADQSYLQWFTKQPAAAQIDILGPVRYGLWKKGSYTVDQFYGKDGRFLTLDQLIRKSA